MSSRFFKDEENFNDSIHVVQFYWECLLFLFIHFHHCNVEVENLSKYIEGAILSVETVCKNGHFFKWTFHPSVGR